MRDFWFQTKVTLLYSELLSWAQLSSDTPSSLDSELLNVTLAVVPGRRGLSCLAGAGGDRSCALAEHGTARHDGCAKGELGAERPRSRWPVCLRGAHGCWPVRPCSMWVLGWLGQCCPGHVCWGCTGGSQAGFFSEYQEKVLFSAAFRVFTSFHAL